MATQTSRLIVELLDRVSGPARSVANSIRKIGRVSRENRRLTFGERLDGAMTRVDASLARARGGLFDAAAAAYTMKTAIGAPISAAMDFESAMADVRKVVDEFSEGDGAEKRFGAFKKEIVDLSKEIPISAEGLAAIAAAAGEAGIAADDLTKFTRQAGIASTAFGMDAEHVAGVMFKLKNVFGMSVDDLSAFNDTVNHISNTLSAKAPEVLDFTNRAAGAAEMLGLTADQVAGFGGALIDAGVKSETAARGVNALATRLRTGAKGVDETMRKIGMTRDEFLAMVDEDGDAAMLEMFSRLSDLPLNDQAKALKALVGQDFSDDFLKILANPENLKKAFDLSNDADKAGSAFREFQVRIQTLEAQLKLFKNRLDAALRPIGNALIPGLKKLMKAMQPVIDGVSRFAKAHPELVKNIVAATGAVLSFKIALAGLRYLGLFGLSSMLHGVAGGYRAIAATAGPLGRAVGQSVGLQRSLAAMAGTRLGVLGTIRAGLSGIAGVTGLTAVARGIRAVTGGLARGLKKIADITGLTAVARGVRAVARATGLVHVPKGIGLLAKGLGKIAGVAARLTGLKLMASGITAIVAAIGAISAPVWVPIAAAIAAVGAAWVFWDRITAIVSGVASAIGEQLGPVMDGIKEKLDFLEPIVRPVGEAFAFLGEKISAAWQAIKDFFSGDMFREKLGDEEFASIEARAKAVATAIITSIKQAFRDFFEWVRSIPDKIINAIGEIDLSDAIKWPEIPPEIKALWKRLFGEDKPEPIKVTREDLAADAAAAGQTEQQRAEAVIADAGNLPTAGELADMGAEAEGLRDKIAAINREIRNTPRGRGGDRKIAQLEADLGPLKARLAEVESDIAEATRRTGELQVALEIVGSADVTPNINDSAIRQARRQAEALERSLNRINGASPAPGAAGADVDGQKARGGPITRGATYLTGERGPEIVAATRSAYVATAQATKRLAGLARAPGLGARLAPITGAAERATAGLERVAGAMAPKAAPAASSGPDQAGAVQRLARAMQAPAAADADGGRKAPAPAAPQPNQVTLAPVFNFTGVSGPDAGQIQSQVRTALQEEVRELFRGVMGDTGIRIT